MLSTGRPLPTDITFAPARAPQRPSKKAGVIHCSMVMSDRPRAISPSGLTMPMKREEFSPGRMRQPVTSMPRERQSARIFSPKTSPPMAEISLTPTPNRARFSARLRASPPGSRRILPALKFWGIRGPEEKPLTSILAPPMTTA